MVHFGLRCDAIVNEQAKGARSFEELHIFGEARQLVMQIWQATRSGNFARDSVLVNQIRRSTLSVVSNIAEGFERQSRPEFARFLVIAKGSCGEVRAQLLVALDQNYLNQEQHQTLCAKTRQISAGLANLTRYLRNATPSKRKSNASEAA
jgi:four helix bundle protein